MTDEKYIRTQDIDKDIMVKSFVVFEGIQDISKGRRALINRFVFSHYGEKFGLLLEKGLVFFLY